MTTPTQPNDSSAESVLGRIISEAPEDVATTTNRLQTDGWHLTRSNYSYQAFGNLIVEFRKTDREVRIVRDRSQWMVSIRLADWAKWVDLELVLDAKNGRTYSWAVSEEVRAQARCPISSV